MRNISVNGVKHVLQFITICDSLEFISLVAKLQKLEWLIEEGIDAFVEMTQKNTANIDRRNLLVKLLLMVVRHPFFIWGHNHGIIDSAEILKTTNLLTEKREIEGRQIKITIKIIESFLVWSKRMRRFGLTSKHSA